MAVGPQLLPDQNVPTSARYGKTGENVITAAHGKYYEAAGRGVLFAAGDQGAGVTVQTSISTTGILSLHNPRTSARRLAIKKVSIAYFSGTLGAGAFYHGVNTPGQTLPTSGTTLASTCLDVGSNFGSGAAAVGVAITGATVVAATVLWPFASSLPVLASTAVWPSTIIEDLDGAIVLEPGTAYQLCAVMGGGGSTPKISCGVVWEEVPFSGTNG